jgi:hypothetical protein
MNYEWNFPTLDVVYHEESMTDVVQTVHWTYTATEEPFTASMYGTVSVPEPTPETTASMYGTVSVPAPTPETFVPYDELTKEQVTGWVETALGPEQIATMQETLAGQIEAQKNPTSGPLPPPWN